MAEYRTLREIAQRMRWKSPATVLRRHKLDHFPLYFDYTKRGLIWVTSDELILEWERRKAELTRGPHRLKQPWKRRHKPTYKPYNWRLKKKPTLEEFRDYLSPKRTLIETEASPSIPERRGPPTREGPEIPIGCSCGTAQPCTAHEPTPLNHLESLGARMAQKHFNERKKKGGSHE